LGIHWDPDPGEADWRHGKVERHIGVFKELATEACIELTGDGDLEEIFDYITAAHNNTVKQSGQSPWQMLLGRTSSGLGLEGADDAGPGTLSRRISANTPTPLKVNEECWKAHIAYELSQHELRPHLAKTRAYRQWSAGERSWYWRAQN
jgi:hypothetical protein